MIRKVYVVVALGIVSVLLGGLFYMTQAERGREATEAEVLNLPIDEHGNLKTTTVQKSKTMLVFNQTLTVPSSSGVYHYLTSFNTSGYKHFNVVAKIPSGSVQWGARVTIYFHGNNFGIRTAPRPTGGYFSLETQFSASPRTGCGTSDTIEIRFPSVDLHLEVVDSNIGFDGLLTIAVWLSN